jgi:hypothetical protein
MSELLYELKESNFHYVNLIKEIVKLEGEKYDNFIIKNKKYKLSNKQYLSIIYVDEQSLIHLQIIEKLLPLLTISSTTNIWTDIINNTSLENIINFQDEKIISHILNYTTLNKFMLFNQLYKRIKKILIPIAQPINNDIIKRSNHISIYIKTPYENYVGNIGNLERLEISIMLKIVEFEITNIDFLKELTNRFLNNIELWIHHNSAIYCCQYAKTVASYFLAINTTSSKYVYNRLIQLANHWFDETIVVEVLGSLCIDYNQYIMKDLNNNDIPLIWSILGIMNKKQVCLLKNIVNNYRRLIDEDIKIWRTKYDNTILDHLEKNIIYISNQLQTINCNIYPFTPHFPFLDVESQESQNNEAYLTQQGLNELYLKEKIYCKNNINKIKDIKDFQDYFNFLPSRIPCKKCYQEYVETCKQIKKCNEKLSIDENKKMYNIIESCIIKRLKYKHTCEHKVDSGHDLFITEKEKPLQHCKEIINKNDNK